MAKRCKEKNVKHLPTLRKFKLKSNLDSILPRMPVSDKTNKTNSILDLSISLATIKQTVYGGFCNVYLSLYV